MQLKLISETFTGHASQEETATNWQDARTESTTRVLALRADSSTIRTARAILRTVRLVPEERVERNQNLYNLYLYNMDTCITRTLTIIKFSIYYRKESYQRTREGRQQTRSFSGCRQNVLNFLLFINDFMDFLII